MTKPLQGAPGEPGEPRHGLKAGSGRLTARQARLINLSATPSDYFREPFTAIEGIPLKSQSQSRLKRYTRDEQKRAMREYNYQQGTITGRWGGGRLLMSDEMEPVLQPNGALSVFASTITGESVFPAFEQWAHYTPHTPILLHRNFEEPYYMAHTEANPGFTRDKNRHHIMGVSTLDQWCNPEHAGVRMVDFISRDVADMPIRIRLASIVQAPTSPFDSRREDRFKDKLYVGVAEHMAPHKMLTSFTIGTADLLGALAMLRSANIKPGYNFLRPEEFGLEGTGTVKISADTMSVDLADNTTP